MNPYLTAIQALEDCVKDAMENNVDASTQSEIWRHYQGIKAIAKQLDQDTISFNIDTDSLCSSTVTFPDATDFVTGEPISLNLSTDTDTITFV
ncbi:hypothetical protein PSSM7_212 [Prochlorococcus phage P-SSM7]|uniref:Uncharacterized protein n=1 Tax=Prochlorococcus phage P-SSM7 TaxID=445688 RepID=E3SNX6_9CAUD|nr:hypothetical protein PSSM7_212 [Prochlorococcus phage P-SSM7]ADO98895.1 hypothetical protein PSSM7_212 [Prochlorococcus phage P-SSM7]